MQPSIDGEQRGLRKEEHTLKVVVDLGSSTFPTARRTRLPSSKPKGKEGRGSV